MKKYLLTLSVLLIAVAITSFCPQEKGWSEFSPSNSNCSVLMPGEPALKEKVLNSDLGEIKLVMYMYQPPKDGNDPNVAYAISYMDYPADRITSDSTQLIKAFFDNARDGAIRSIQGKLLTEEIIKYKQYPGREQRIDFRNGMVVIKYRHYLVKNRLYSLQVITPTENNFNKSINKFLDSFKVLNE